MKVLLHNKELWQRFREHQTEMMITKSGRSLRREITYMKLQESLLGDIYSILMQKNIPAFVSLVQEQPKPAENAEFICSRRMCPVISLKFEDLNSRQFYTVMIDFVLMDEFRYSFEVRTNSWIPYCREMPADEGCAKVFVHPQTPVTGATLMQNGLCFKTLKLTNSLKTAGKSAQAILVNTMRRYTPRIHVLESPNGMYFDYNLRKEFYFPEMEFMAVSQYRNKNITALKIDANPFASAYRRHGLHGQAKRRRLELQGAGEEGRTSEDGPPSNSSSVQDSLTNSDEPDVDNNYLTEFLEGPSPEESTISDEQRVNGTNPVSNPVSPCQTTGSSDVVSDSANVTEAQEKLSNVTQVLQSQSPNQTSEAESNLTCEESSDWMWGFDEQFPLRYECENPMQGRQGVSGNSEQNGNNVKESSTEEAKATVNRRKKYVPRRLQRRNDVYLKNVHLDSKDKDETKGGKAVNENTVNEMEVLSSLPNNTIGDDSGKPEEACCSDDATISIPLPRLGAAEKAPVTCSDSVIPETVSSYADALLPSRFRTEAGVMFVIGQNDSRAARSAVGTENTTGSSLTALIEMCSKAGESVSTRSCLSGSVRTWGTVTRATGCNSSLSLASQSDLKESLRPSVIPVSSQYNGHATTSEEAVVASAVSTCNGSPVTGDTMGKSPTATDPCPTGSIAVETSCFEKPFPVIVDTFSGYYILNGFNSGQQLDNKQRRYRPIVPAPSKSLNTASFEDPATVANVKRSDCNNDVIYPTILDCFSLANHDEYAVGEKQPLSSNPYFIPSQNSPQPRVNQVHFSLQNHSDCTTLDNNLLVPAVRLEKFYSFPTLGERVKSPARPSATRHYKTTRTNFSRLSLEPICSVIYPLDGSRCQSTPENSATSEDLTQREWGWRLR